MVVSLKANRKRILAFICAGRHRGGGPAFSLRAGGRRRPGSLSPGGTNEERVAFLESSGWQVQAEPTETREVMIPAQSDRVYTAYNVMQQAQGFDLEPYAGQICTQYVYEVESRPGDEQVYATLLVYGDEIIGGEHGGQHRRGRLHARLCLRQRPLLGKAASPPPRRRQPPRPKPRWRRRAAPLKARWDPLRKAPPQRQPRAPKPPGSPSQRTPTPWIESCIVIV